MTVINFIKKNWVITIIFIFAVSNLLAGISGLSQTSLIPSIFLFLILLMEFYDRYLNSASSEKLLNNSEKTLENTENTNRMVIQLDKKVDVCQQKRETIYEDTELLVELVNHGVISIKRVVESIPRENFITILCHQDIEKPPSSGKREFKKSYYSTLSKLGFVKIGTGYYIIAERNLFPEEFRDLDKLSQYIMLRAKRHLDEDWINIMDVSKNKYPIFYKNRIGKENPLDFSIIISRVNATEMIHKFVKKPYFQNFQRELISISSIRKKHLDEDSLTNVKTFLLKSSIKILIRDLPKEDKKKVISLEKNKFTKSIENGGLGITKIYEYWRVNSKDISDILRKEFNQELTEKYTTIIQKRSKKYEESLKKLGINL